MKNDIVRTIKMSAENWEHVKRISDELDAIVDGRFKNIDWEAVEIQTDADGNAYIEHDGVFYTEVGAARYDEPETEDIDDLNDYTLFDYFADALDINYIVNGDKTYKAVRICVACGGPNIYVDTFRGVVSLYWWSDFAEYDLRRDVIDAIDAMFCEYWECC